MVDLADEPILDDCRDACPCTDHNRDHDGRSEE